MLSFDMTQLDSAGNFAGESDEKYCFCGNNALETWRAALPEKNVLFVLR